MSKTQLNPVSVVILISAGMAALTGCTSPAPAPAPSPTASAAASPSRPACPNPHGGRCLGLLEAGTYTTELFIPELTYEVPEGWSNLEDLPGNFLLVPPDGTLDGVDLGTSDYIGIYTSIVALEPSCTPERANTGRTPEEIAAWLTALPGLVVTDGGAVQVGGLDGRVLDLALAPGGGLVCDGREDFQLVPLFIGSPPSDLEHAMIPGLTMRLYLLGYQDGTLAVEVDDVSGGANLAGYSEIVERLRFAG